MRGLLGIGITPTTTVSIYQHVHPVWEIIYFTERSGILRLEQGDVPFEPGDMFCLPPGTPHSEHSGDGYGNIFFTLSEFDLPFGGGVVALKDTQSRDIGVLLQLLYKEYHLKRNRWKELTEQLLNAVYAYSLALMSRQRKHGMVEQLEEALVANLGQASFRLDRCMAQFPVSADYLRRMFKQATGKTPIQYLTGLRIEFAKRLFEKSGSDQLSVKLVASLVGYDDSYYFSRVFKAEMGISPQMWMKERGILT
ncbi:AraC family transcriptional regulator [Paenibacillus agaridevorans]|uniref:AraC family transcriptional regulator n=1 Tax=Paenibacillus agaridevorans TaxID=171404 RepID=A0A2R5EWU8_9BACL|nr:AraC family transcriptional regulator [Paenibacillus agaridevorans]GBG11186.1 AraC family transcriptional regulator [Paenibacillus agaridevorans]